MAKYDYNINDYESNDLKITLLENIANELAEANRLKRLEMNLDYRDIDNELMNDLLDQIKDQA